MINNQRVLLLLSLCLILPIRVIACNISHDTIQVLRGIDISVPRYRLPITVCSSGTYRILPDNVEKLPQILGYSDYLQTSKLLPHIGISSEYDAGLHIMGCDNAHNDVSIDGVPLYGGQHLFGFFSIFNSSHFSGLTYAPSASFTSCSNKIGGSLRAETYDSIEANNSGDLSIGLLSSQGTMRLRIGKKAMLLVSAREAYMNLLYKHWLKVDDVQTGYSFGDYNFTFIRHNTNKDFLKVLFYAGHDNVSYDSELNQATIDLKWGNILAGLLHSHTYDENKSLKESISFSRFANQLNIHQQEFSFTLPSSIMDISYHSSYTNKDFNVGTSISFQSLVPQNPQLNGMNHKDYPDKYRQNVGQLTVFGKYGFNITNHISITPMLKGIVYIDDQCKTNLLPAPNMTVEWANTPIGSMSIHYAWQQQTLFQTGITSLGLPIEFWVAAGKYGKPQYAHHLSLSHDIILWHGNLRITSSLYYKWLFNQIEYQSDLFDYINTNHSLDQAIIHGDGYNYGASIMLSRQTGSLTGWISYTYSRSMRRFEGLNNSVVPSNHDRPHELKAVANWHLNKHWDISGSFVYCSGTPYTTPQYLYLIDANILMQPGPYNGARLKPYKRLDLAVNYTIKDNEKSRCGLNFTLYNALAFKNELYYAINLHNLSFSYTPQSFILPCLPSLSFYYKWK